MEKLSLVRMTAGSFGCFWVFSSQIVYYLGYYILLGIAAKGDIQYLAQFFEMVKTMHPLPSKEKKKKCFNQWLLQGLLGPTPDKCQEQVLGNDMENYFEIQNGNSFHEGPDDHR